MVTTQAVTDVTKNDAIGHGTIVDRGIPDLTEHGLCWSRAPAIPTVDNNEGISTLGAYAGPVPHEFESIISPLVPFRNYNVRAYATNSAGTVYGGTQPFQANPDAMVVGTVEVTNIEEETATGGGDITNLGIPAATQHGICWNTTGTPDIGDSRTRLGVPAGTGLFTSDLTDLMPGTTYYVRAYTENDLGTVYGGEVVFTTLKLPEVATLPASSIGDTTATGNGDIIHMGIPPSEAHGVCWNTTGDPTLEDSDGFTDKGVVLATGWYTSNMKNLSPDTIYYVRAYATNTVGTVYGVDDDSFITEPLGSSGSWQGRLVWWLFYRDHTIKRGAMESDKVDRVYFSWLLSLSFS